MIRGFSLLEVLAATVILGLLAVAVVPMTRSMLDGRGNMQDRLQAQELLAALDPATLPRSGVPTPLAQHSGWWLRSDQLIATVPSVTPGSADPRPRHGWRCIELVDGPNVSAQVLAIRMVMEGAGSP